jgi:hypothetical protein
MINRRYDAACKHVDPSRVPGMYQDGNDTAQALQYIDHNGQAGENKESNTHYYKTS